MYCIRCGNKYDNDDNICQNCGYNKDNSKTNENDSSNNHIKQNGIDILNFSLLRCGIETLSTFIVFSVFIISGSSNQILWMIVALLIIISYLVLSIILSKKIRLENMGNYILSNLFSLVLYCISSYYLLIIYCELFGGYLLILFLFIIWLFYSSPIMFIINFIIDLLTKKKTK